LSKLLLLKWWCLLPPKFGLLSPPVEVCGSIVVLGVFI
jgi:hypothetical protein